MQLIEYIENNPHQNVKIGTKNGGGFIFIGDTDVPPYKLVKIWKNYKAKYRELRDSYSGKIVAYKKGLKKRDLKKKERDTTKRKLEYAIKREEYLTKYLNKRNHGFLQREVLDIYDSIIDATYKIIIIEGIEVGSDENELEMPPITELEMEGIYKFLESIFNMAADDLAAAYRWYLRNPRNAEAKRNLEQAERFYRDSPLVDWSGADGDDAIRTIKARVRRPRKLAKVETVGPIGMLNNKELPVYYFSRAVDKQFGIISSAQLGRELGVSPGTANDWRTKKWPGHMTEKYKRALKILDIYDEVSNLPIYSK